ncbi:MAG: DUF342 domain-containing protein, partial [Candidatus Sericytochromatia bacterium]
MAQLILSDDELQATLLLGEGEALTPDAARVLLAEKGVAVGVSESVLASLDGAVGPLALVVAEGVPPVHGVDAHVSFLFRSGPQDLRPVIRPDGTADFRNLGAVEHAVTGQVLVKREPPRPGQEGRSVRNRPIKARVPYDQKLAAGDGATVTPDGLTVVATREGNPHRRGHVVLVLPQYTVTGSVSLATGNIQYEGDLVILGHVEQQMAVHATGNVTIRGNVEGARVTAGGGITVEGGVRPQAPHEAAHHQHVKFCENSTIRCGGSVGVQEDLVHGKVEAGTAVVAGGAIVGGETQVSERVEARMLGARLGTATQILVMPPVVANEALKAVEAERESIQANLNRISPKIREAQDAIANPSINVDMTVFRKILELAGQLAERDAALAEQARQLAETAPRARASVAMREGSHPGVRVQIGMGHLAVKDPLPACTLIEER